MTYDDSISKQNRDKTLYSLELHLERQCSKHPHLKLLESQWRFDQELISKALQNVSSIFPHYSRHDASHSKQIVVNIERMLGDKIQYLSATDTWLILEAAYNHDIGMVITSKQLEDMESTAFKEFVEDIAKDKNNDLNKFAKKWLADTATLPMGTLAHDFVSKYIQLLAEWYRKKHPENSAKIVRNPYQEIGLDSPRNELLPKRLFRVLADICLAHGQDFDDVKKLPHAEAGMATEDCHPRYVACLLRMGDLLDLDDNRFCPVMMHMCGHNFPKISQAHYDKHHSIKHFRLDTARIEVESESPNLDAYEAAYDWFQWLEQEYNKQTQYWDKIVPCKELGNLPILSNPKVTILEPYLSLEPGKKPNFKIDNAAILELVRGTGLYDSKFDCIREILQNAVDATLMAIWQIHEKEIMGLKLDPTSKELHKIYAQYPINVRFEPDPECDDYWILKVQDHGSGISFETLKYMLSIGSSSKNKSKTRLIEQMPKWYRPSGNFGLGLQSVYLITNKFSLTTKCLETHEALQIDFSNEPSRPVVIKKIDPKAMDYGTTFEASIKITKFPKSISWNFETQEIMSNRLINYDFTKNGSDLKAYETINIIHAIFKFSSETPIQIAFKDLKEKSKKIIFLTKSPIFYCQTLILEIATGLL